jgi:hypothetical protein
MKVNVPLPERFYDDIAIEMVTPCSTCRHLYADAFSCAAFPDGIPEEILLGEHQHKTPFDGDNGIRYESADGNPTEGKRGDL